MDWITVDANEAVARIAYRLSEVIGIYPITPSSSMAELSDAWSAEGRPNLWGELPSVTEMQSEAGAAGALHGALQGGALATTFTASQGLLLMIPNMFKIAGELLPMCMHVTARAVATHALSIFGDHSDVMACRSTGFAMLCAGSPLEAQDLAAIAHAATYRARVPFLHFFDGFRTSHEVAKIPALSDDDLRAMIDERDLAAHRARALSPDHPVLRGTAHNPDTFFQAREASAPYYDACVPVVREMMARFAARTGRAYRPFDYVGAPDAERVIVMMGSGAEAAHELVDWLVARGEKVGLVKVRLYRPFSLDDFLAALPPSTRLLAVLDRTKEPGAVGEPLYTDVVGALAEAVSDGKRAAMPHVVNGRYGLGGKELTPAMLLSVYQELAAPAPRRRFTLGIVDDVAGSSLPWDRAFDLEPADVTRAVFYGLGSDGTVGANKSSIKIIGHETDLHAQGYFVYDSKKSGAMTVSHLRFGPRPIRSTYLVQRAAFVAIHHLRFLDREDTLALAAEGATLLVNAPGGAAALWGLLPREAQETILARRLRVYAIDALAVAKRHGLGKRINTIMQTCFFALANVLPPERAIAAIKQATEESYGKKGAEVVARNLAAIDDALAHLDAVALPGAADAARTRPPIVPSDAPPFVQRVTAAMMAGHGDLLPVSAFPVDGTWPTSTARWEKRNLAAEIPTWDTGPCIQCNKCALFCPHAAIRVKVYPADRLAAAPPSVALKSMDYKATGALKGQKYTVQVSPEDCTGCRVCVEVCPTKVPSLTMVPSTPELVEAERRNDAFFLALPDADRAHLPLDIKGSQLRVPLFEYSGACSGCGETPYIKLMTQLFGDRAVVANATGCSSIVGGNLPTTPYCVNAEGRGPAWANSLFEDNAEFGFGIRLAIDAHRDRARALVRALAPRLGDTLVTALLEADQSDDAGIAAQRARVAALVEALRAIDTPNAQELLRLSEYLVKRSVWIVGGDGWAYDIGYGGLDHVIASGRDVNLLVLDTEVYSNTGGQQSKATPLGAAAKFAAGGKPAGKKDLGLHAMAYGTVYVASVALGAKDAHTVKAFVEAESFPGPSLIIAYSPCIAHGYDLADGPEHQKLAVEVGAWPLYRYDPRRVAAGEPPLHLDSGPPKGALGDYVRSETRFRALEEENPAHFAELLAHAEAEVRRRYALYEHLAKPIG